MKTNNEVACHNFAKGARADLNIYSNNICIKKSYDGNEIYLYSYNTIIAIYNIKKDIFLVSTQYYSSTTCKHQLHLKRALQGYNTIYMENCNLSNGKILKNFMDNLKDYSIKQLRARKSDYASTITAIIENCNKFLEYCNYDKRKKEYKNFIKVKNSNDDKRVGIILELNKKELLKAEKLRKLHLKALKEDRLKETKEMQEINFENFLNDRQKSFEMDDKFYKIQKRYNDYAYKIKTYNLKELEHVLWYKDILKVTQNNNVITSQNVPISKIDFIRLYKAFKAGKLSAGSDVVGYKIRDIKKDYVIIGCHTIALKDIKYIYNKLIKGA